MLGHGRSLHAAEFNLLKLHFQPHTLHEVRIFEDKTPIWLSRRMCAVVLGTHIYSRKNSYQFNTSHGLELLAHELTHVEQYLSGMSILKYL
jgi:hypothetical protein